MLIILLLIILAGAAWAVVRARRAEAAANQRAQQTQDELFRVVTAREKDLAERGKRAIRGARSTFDGHVAEHAFPYQEDHPYHPKDVFHIGGTIDFLVLDGLFEFRQGTRQASDLVVVLADVKYGSGSLTPEQRAVLSAVNAGQVRGECWTARETPEGQLAYRQREVRVPKQVPRALPEGS